MSVFPDIRPSYDYTIASMFRTLKIGPTDGDFIQRRRKRIVPLHIITIKWDVLSQVEEKTLYDFYIARSGPWQDFAFFDFDSKSYSSVTIGTGDGSTKSFNLIAKNTSARTIFVNGVAKSEGVDYTFYSGLGTDGQDKITFGTAPGSGLAITADYTGMKYFKNCIFQDDNFNRNTFSHALYKTGIVILEVSS